MPAARTRVSSSISYRRVAVIASVLMPTDGTWRAPMEASLAATTGARFLRAASWRSTYMARRSPCTLNVGATRSRSGTSPLD